MGNRSALAMVDETTKMVMMVVVMPSRMGYQKSLMWDAAYQYPVLMLRLYSDPGTCGI